MYLDRYLLLVQLTGGLSDESFADKRPAVLAGVLVVGSAAVATALAAAFWPLVRALSLVCGIDTGVVERRSGA